MTETSAIDSFADRIRTGGHGGLVSAWVGIPEPMVVHHLTQEDFDAVVLDMQHGMWDMASASNAVAQCRSAGKPAIARIPVGDFASASRLLDAGCTGIIAPMVNSVADAQALVRFTKYPPLGERSWGPTLALNHMKLSGDDYLRTANRLTLTIAMVETRAALDAVDGILGVEGIDGIFVGPSDLSIALSKGEKLAPDTDDIDKELSRIVARCRAHKKFVCAFGSDGKRAGGLLKLGCDLVVASADTTQLRAGAASAIAAARSFAVSG
ncbi:aldolase/citrate lyase family protein (plasmid) [Rhizobium sullae]|uniref:Aldolase/citrate lyase family protein n=1 Tax=Rhizobium sullae TaxID=50338 RepID=A0A2N0D7K3_RHISU|nr:aldolase/citrate lyase family protein [Rhizobium sullae]PKA42056.1 hydroxyacid aldolase [Rhizobium sullae]UWU18442.1 aldolase/citrate lyase family protein [Rhizobium sullae]